MQIVVPLFYRNFLVVDGQTLVLVRHNVARQSNHPLDVIFAGIDRVAKHHHLAALRFIHIEDFGVKNGQAHAIGVFVDQNEIAIQQRRHHGFRRDTEGFDEKRAQQKHHQQHGKQATAVFYPPGVFHIRAATLFQPEVGNPDRAGDEDNDEKNQRKIKIHEEPSQLSTRNTARKASWGISTLPTCFMRFLPAFCFSSSFFLRVMSPP